MITVEPEQDHTLLIATTKQEGLDIELLLLSKKIPFSSYAQSSKWKYLVPLEYSDLAIEELSQNWSENRDWPPPKHTLKNEQFHFSPFNGMIVFSLVVFHILLKKSGSYRSFIADGRFSAELILNGEWERTITALMLHADDVHMFSNALPLWFFACGVSQYLGVGQAWFFILLTGALGNYMNAFFFQYGHSSIGASTAIFSALGLMGGIRVASGVYKEQPFRYRVRPIVAVFCVFALLGVNPETDIMAHAFGLLAGTLCGLALKRLTERKYVDNNGHQRMAFSIFLGTILWAWV